MSYLNAIVSLVLFLMSVSVFAGENTSESKNADSTDRKFGEYTRYLSGYRPSYIAMVDETDNDEEHLEFSLSVKYPLIGEGGDSSLYFAYTGDYDFYLSTRESAPVISRRQNPGFFYRYKWVADDDMSSSAISIGWFHESNGQTIETREEYESTPNASDYVSRGWDYLSLGWESEVFGRNSGLYIDTELKIFCHCQAFGFIDEREDQIFWKDMEKQPHVNDYDGVNLKMYYTIKRDTRFSLGFRAGNRDSDALSNVSYRLDVVLPIFSLPVKFFYFNGYGVNISTYHEKASYYGVGFDFW